MKYKGTLKYPKVGDKIEIKRYGTTYTVTNLSKTNLSQGDLVMGYEKGIHCFMGWVKSDYEKTEFALLKKVYTDKIQPKIGPYSVCCQSFCESPRKFFEEYRTKYSTALKIIDEYLPKKGDK